MGAAMFYSVKVDRSQTSRSRLFVNTGVAHVVVFVLTAVKMYSYSDELNPSAKERYDLKLQTVGCSCPYKLPGKEWENDPTKWP